MNNKHFIIGMLFIAMLFSFAIKKNSIESVDSKNNFFIESDNIAFAEDYSYSCVPTRPSAHCPLPGAAVLYGYYRVWPS